MVSLARRGGVAAVAVLGLGALAWAGPANRVVSCREAPPDVEACAEGDETCEERPPLPSRVSLTRSRPGASRHQRHDPFGPFAHRAGETPRPALLARLAAEGRPPRFSPWRRGELRSMDGRPMTDPHRRFEGMTVPAGPSRPTLTVWTADPERWGSVLGALPSEECPCISSGGPGQPTSPGRVPDGERLPGVPLTVAKSVAVPGDLDLSWGASCKPASDYSVQEGNIGGWYTHTSHTCSTGGLSVTITPGAGSHYYLIVPLNSQAEGSYGTDSAGVQRPRSTSLCRSRRALQTCP